MTLLCKKEKPLALLRDMTFMDVFWSWIWDLSLTEAYRIFSAKYMPYKLLLSKRRRSWRHCQLIQAGNTEFLLREESYGTGYFCFMYRLSWIFLSYLICICRLYEKYLLCNSFWILFLGRSSGIEYFSIVGKGLCYFSNLLFSTVISRSSAFPSALIMFKYSVNPTNRILRKLISQISYINLFNTYM